MSSTVEHKQFSTGRHGGGGLGRLRAVVQYDLASTAESLRASSEYQKGDPASRLLLKEPSLKIVLMALRSNGKMQRHNVSGPVSIHCLEGHIALDVGSQPSELSAGGLVSIEPGVEHDITATEDSLVLLTIGSTFYTPE